MEAKTFFNDRYLPLRDAVQALGGTVSWNHGDKSSHVTLNGRTAVIDMDTFTVAVDGATVATSAPALIQDGTLYVPTDFFPNVFNAQNPA